MEGESSEKKLEQLARMDYLSALATPGGCSVCFAQVNAVCNVDSFCHDSRSGRECGAVESRPNREDPRKALVFEEGDNCAKCIRKPSRG